MFFLIYFAMMIKPFFPVFAISFFLCLNIHAQTEKPLYAANSKKEARAKEYKYLVTNSISKNLLLPLTDSTEENWQEAFNGMELLNYRTPFIDARIHTAMDSVEDRSTLFQKAMLQLIYPLYPNRQKIACGRRLSKSLLPRR